MVNNFQRVGTISNTQVGSAFEDAAQQYFRDIGIGKLQKGFGVAVGVVSKKTRKFDLGSNDPKILVECKSHTWTMGGNTPSAKINAWTEAMFYFLLAPKEYRKILFVLKDTHEKRQETLAEYYIRTRNHLIPNEVEIMEYERSNSVRKLR